MQRTLLVIPFLFLAFCTSAQLNGAFTIGGINPSFADFTAAATALSTQGISGNVTFNVRPGTYTERIQINAIPGSNANRTVTFQAENGDSSSVLLLSTTATNTTNYLISLQNVARVTLKRLSFQTPESGLYSTAVALYNVSNFRMENCRLSGSLNSAPQSTNGRITLLITGINPNVTVKNCLFRNGYQAISVLGGETLVSADMVIENNRFKGALAEALVAVYAHQIKVQKNVVDTCALGFRINYCSTAVVQHNRIYTTYYGCLGMYECRGTANTRCLVANNMMSNAGENTQVNGALIQSCRYLDFVYNSLNILSGSDDCKGLFLANSSRYIRIQNNSIVVRPGGLPVVTQNELNEVEVYSHCNLYDGTVVADLPPNSISRNPFYASTSDLHVSNAVLNGLGTPLSSVSTDADGESRNALTPDIGADEYTPVQRSVAVAGFVNPSVDSIYCAALPLEILLQNTGLETLSSATLTVTLNGVAQAAIPWTGSLASGEAVQVSLGLQNLVPLQGNTVSVQCSSPNTDTDFFAPDDVLTFENLFSGLSGTYTIGGADGDFPSFTAAVNNASKGGLCGNTTLLVRDGVYNEQVQIWPLKGSSPQRWLTFEGESGDSTAAVLSAAASVNNTFTLRTQLARFLKFKHLKIKQTANPYNVSPVFIAFGTDITFENCIIEGYFSGNSSDSEYAFAAFPDSNLTVRHCVIQGAGMGANLVGTGPQKYNLIFENNRVYGASDDCLNLQKWRNVRVRNNEFGAASFNSLYGIYGLNLNNYDISNNRIGIGGVQATVGMYLINCSNFNKDISLVSNNSISMNLGTGIVAVGRGMWIINCDSIQLIHNTIRHNSADTDNLAFDMQNSKGAYVVNNVFVNTGLGLAFNSVGNTASHFDYNVYFTNGAQLCYSSAELSGIQALTGADQHSVQGSPMWTNALPDSLSLHNPVLENIGTETEVLTDLRGFARQLPNPDPGAFETPSAPLVQLGPDVAACGQVALQGFAPGASAYLWNTGATTPGITVDSSGTYILMASNAIGSSTDTIEVIIYPFPEVFAGQDVAVCSGDTVVLQGNSTGDCVWSDASGNPLDETCALVIPAQQSGAYILVATSADLCQASDTMMLQVLPLPALPVVERSGGVLSVSSTGALQWLLDGNPIDGANEMTWIPLVSGMYSVQATNQEGCSVVSEPYFFVESSTAAAPERAVRIFPNPVGEGHLFVQVSGDFVPERFAFYNLQGQLQSNGVVKKDALDRFHLPAPAEKGVYFLKLSASDGFTFLHKIEVL